MIKSMIYGCNGKMGQVLSEQLLNQVDFEIVAGIDRNTNKYNNDYPVYTNPYEYTAQPDIIIDFSHPSYLDEMLKYASDKKVPLVIATTGFTDEQLSKIRNTSLEIPVLHSANMSLGINIIARLLKQMSHLADEGFDIEIIEKHHNKKLDAPSGTAYLLANTINESLGTKKRYTYGRQGRDAKREETEIGIHALRGGTIAGEHTIIFAGLDEIIELKHTALSKNIFAIGAIKAAKFLVKKEPGFYTIDDMFDI